MQTTQSDTDATLCSSVSSLTLRPYQEEGVRFLTQHRGGRGCLYDQMGIGKTPQAIEALKRLRVVEALVVAPKIVLGVWQSEVQRWWPEATVVVLTGAPGKRTTQLANFSNIPKPRLLVTNYQFIDEVKGCYPWFQAIIYDEAHLLKNRKTKTFQAATKLRSKFLFLLTGSPIAAGGQDLWTHLHLLSPSTFGSYWRFVNRYFLMEKNGFGGFDIIGPKDAPTLRGLVNQFSIRRTKEQVLPELPPKQRQAIRVELEPEQRKLYDQLSSEMVAELESEPQAAIASPGQMVLTPSSLALLTRLRQINLSPRLLFDEYKKGSSTISSVVSLTSSALESGQSVVIFTPFRQAIPLIKAELQPVMPLGAQPLEIHGQIPQPSRQLILRAFDRSTRPSVLICTTSLGLGWSATKASVAVFAGYDWSRIPNIQSEDRLHRMGQKNPVNVYYIVNQNTIDEHILDVLDEKTRWEALALRPKEFLMPS